MIELKNVTITMASQEDRPLIKRFSFSLNKADKVAIIGEEGNGKSTLLKYIYNENLIKNYCNFKGQVIKTGVNIGYLEQILNSKWNNYTVMDFFLKDDVEEDINYEIYNNYINIKQSLCKLNIDPSLLESNRLISSFSGGEKMKLQIAKIVSKQCDVFLLDEPTNDLDIDSLQWLESFINSINVPVMFVSHDETLIQNCANCILHFEQLKKKTDSKYTISRLSYEDYINKRLCIIQKQDKIAASEKHSYNIEKKKLQEMKEKVQNANPGRNNRMNSILAHEERLNSTLLDEKPDIEKAISLKFNEDIYLPNSKMILDIKIDHLKTSGIIIANNLSLKVIGPEHVVMVGTNGIGKSTFLKEIYKLLKNRDDINLGYMPQDYEDRLNLNKTPITFLEPDAKKDQITQIRTMLGCLKFTSDEMETEMSNLSGGQRAKIFIIEMIIKRCNVLLLDEPTRNLSPLSTPIIRKLLKEYKGAIISISHDRKYIDEVANKIYVFNKNGLSLKSNKKS